MKNKKIRRKRLLFVIGCEGCISTVKKEEYNVAVDKNGVPPMAEVIKVYMKPTMHVSEKCPFCGKKKLTPMVML